MDSRANNSEDPLDAAADASPFERLELITRVARRLFRTPIVLLSLLEKGNLQLAACQGLPISALGREIGLDRRTLATEGPLIVADTRADARFNTHPFVTGRPFIRFYAGCLVVGADGAVAGVLSVCDRNPDALAEGDLIVLRDVARLVETELRVRDLDRSEQQMAAEREHMRRKALIDTGTLLWNRHAMFELLDREFHRARREREHVAVILAEVDQFDAISARYGEAAARAVLAEMALRIRTIVRRSDTVARFSGAEFLVSLGRCPLDAAVNLAERLHHRARHTPVTCNELQIDVSMTVGVAALGPESDWTPDGLVRRAEQALNAARSRGGAQVIAL
jgi:diguanylate cyclase (GGDEF)-like protein